MNNRYEQIKELKRIPGVGTRQALLHTRIKEEYGQLAAQLRADPA